MTRLTRPARLGGVAWAVLLVMLGGGCDRYHDLGAVDGGAPADSGPTADGGAGGAPADSGPAAGGGAPADSGPTADGGADVGMSPPDGPAADADDGPPSLPIEARHIVFDSKSGRLFATVGGAAAAHANSLVVIDVGAARVASSVPIGSQPSTLAISDDGTTLWVGLDGDFSVRKVDLTTEPPTPGKAFTLPKSTTPGYATIAGPMCALQGSTATIAVSMQYSPELFPGLAGVVILDDGVPREMLAPEHTGAEKMVRGEAGWLFGLDNTTAYSLFSLPVTAAGVTQMEFDGLLPASSSPFLMDAELVYAAGRIYATTGPVIDVTAPAAPVRVGAFAFMGAIAPIPAKKRAYMISPPSDTTSPPVAKAQLRVLDTEHFTQVSTTDLPGVTAGDTVWDLIQTRVDQLVFVVGDPSGNGASRIVFLPITPLP